MIEDDTICAISTPAGTGGIAVIRVSGPIAISTINSLWRGADLTSANSHTAHLGELIDAGNGGETLDQCVVTLFRGPKSYTGEDVVEIAVHGSRWIQRETLALLQRNGCRMAKPGEFTRRAVMNGRMDLSQAEGVADVIASTSRAAHRIAVSQMKGGISRKLASLREQLVQLAALLELELDFSEEDVEFADRGRLIDIAESIRTELSRLYRSFSKGNAIKEGIPVAIIGMTNAGKSSLLNALLEDDRAIVSDIHGTTRDTIEETIEIGDYLFRFIDTAGLRETSDPIERIGIERSRKAMTRARIVIAVIDISAPGVIDSIKSGNTASLLPTELTDWADDESRPEIIIALNKIDKIADSYVNIAEANASLSDIPATTLPVSAMSGFGIETLRKVIGSKASGHNNLRYTDGTRADDERESGSIISICDAKNISIDKDDIMITNLRQAEALQQALSSISPLIDGLHSGLETDLVAQHLRETLTHLSAITGEIPSTEILNTIFSSFCVGK